MFKKIGLVGLLFLWLTLPAFAKPWHYEYFQELKEREFLVSADDEGDMQMVFLLHQDPYELEKALVEELLYKGLFVADARQLGEALQIRTDWGPSEWNRNERARINIMLSPYGEGYSLVRMSADYEGLGSYRGYYHRHYLRGSKVERRMRNTFREMIANTVTRVAFPETFIQELEHFKGWQKDRNLKKQDFLFTVEADS